MKPKKRQKLCHNCEGEIDLDVIVCPYCAADLREEKPEQQQWTSVRPLHGSATAIPEPLYSQPSSRVFEEAVPVQEESTPVDASKSIIGPTLLFAVGAQLLVVGLLIALFSHNGVLILKWDARLWFLYLFASIPLLIFGYRSLSRL